jgi:D-alanyl-lipoteichoic acid acyltransferase DltB (MBOAT superfamily)
LPQLSAPPTRDLIERDRAIGLVVVGLFKKVVLASHLGILLSDPVFDAPAEFGGARVLVAIYAYAGQIYCDFSGYTDMAIGSALLLGYRFKDNFAAPYAATSIQEFWRRWHISLSSFLRDYLFIPLGGSHLGEWRTRRNLLVTMLLGGLWHGAGWNFILWGAMHGSAQVIHRAWSKSPAPWIAKIRKHPLWPIAAWLLTFHTVCLGWVFFRAANFAQALEVLRALTRAGTAVPWQAWLLVAVGVLAQVLPWGRWTPSIHKWVARLPSPAIGAAAALAVLVIDALGPIGVPPFIYFQF